MITVKEIIKNYLKTRKVMNKKEWIPVEDSLPELIKEESDGSCSWKESKTMAVLIYGNEYYAAQYIKDINGAWWWNEQVCDEVHGITHWCDCLPEKPETK